MRTILQPEWLVDGTGADAVRDHTVIVHGNQIEAMTPVAALTIEEDDTLIELPGATLLPGLVNNHVHLVLPGDGTFFVPWLETQSDADLALRTAYNSQQSLRAGITTVRDCGGRGRIVIDVRNAQMAGLAGGARIIACGWPLTITGGHTRHFGGEVDGEEGVRRMVRRVVSSGADFVKLMASGGGTPGSYSQYPSFSVAELRAIVDEAHTFERRVVAHCTSAPATRNAIAAGVDMIEHAMFITPDLNAKVELEVVQRLADSGIPVTPTLQVDRDMIETLPAGPERERWQARRQVHHEAVAAMHERGVPLLAGSDAGWRATAFATFWKELDELVACGLSPVAAIHAATGAISAALGQADAWGTIKAGQVADLLVVQGNVAADIRCLAEVKLVYQGGQLVYQV
ncbi:MAG: amidohydrolase family protein [Caldilineaceae bacterium]